MLLGYLDFGNFVQKNSLITILWYISIACSNIWRELRQKKSTKKRKKKYIMHIALVLSEEMPRILPRIANGKIRLFFAKSVFGLPITVDICKSFAMKKSDYCTKTLTCILFHCHISMHFAFDFCYYRVPQVKVGFLKLH